MVISNHIATALAAERQRDLRASYRRGWRLPILFGRRAAELEPVPPVAPAAGGDGPGPSAPAPARIARHGAGRVRAHRVPAEAEHARARRRERAGVQ